jgi:uncharacterized protein YqeY
MELRKQLENTLYDAMRKKDDLLKNTIRMVLSAVKLSEVETGKLLDDPGILSVLHKEVKIRKETITELADTDRSDLVAKAEVELKILESFLPAQATDEEIYQAARQVIRDTDSKSPSDMGKVMKQIIPLLAGKATPDRISAIVKALLSPAQ